MIGSKKYPRLPISLEVVDGMVMFSNDFCSSLSYVNFIVLIFIYFGKNKYIIMHDDVSVIMFSKINIVICIVGDLSLKSGNINITRIIFINCSVILLNICGITFCLP